MNLNFYEFDVISVVGSGPSYPEHFFLTGLLNNMFLHIARDFKEVCSPWL